MRRTALIAAILCVLAAIVSPGRAQAPYPERPVRIVVPYPAGGSLDAVARLVSEQLSTRLGARFYVENVVGGPGTVGTAAVLRAPRDGHNLVMVIDSHAINPSVTKSLPFDPLNDFKAIALIGNSPLILAVHSTVNAATLADFIRVAREKPGALTYASIGYGTQSHLAGELFKLRTATDLLHVPYRGGGPAINDLIAGHVQTMFITPVLAKQHIETGTLKGLAVASPERLPSLPSIPTFTEAGIALEAGYWYGLLAPANVPQAVIDKLDAAMKQTLADASFRQRLDAVGVIATPLDASAFDAFLRAEARKWEAVVQEAKIEKQ